MNRVGVVGALFLLLLSTPANGTHTVPNDCMGVPVNVTGTDGDDYGEATPNNDSIALGAGIDTVFSLASRDHMCGNDGQDFLYGQGGSDEGQGGDGTDHLYGGDDADDTLFGGAHNDEVFGDANGDILEGNFGGDLVSGSHGDDTVRGGDNDDNLYDGHGQDEVRGGDGRDTWRICPDGDGDDVTDVEVELGPDAGYCG
jgi:Ca2+-binding RTX toxin-like protein